MCNIVVISVDLFSFQCLLVTVSWFKQSDFLFRQQQCVANYRTLLSLKNVDLKFDTKQCQCR